MDGWIKLYRQLITNGWLKNHNVCIFWIYCLLKAVHEPTKAIVGFQEVNLEPGQFIFGRKKAAEETGLSEREIRTSQAFMRNAQNMTIKTTNKFSIISIINWDAYQNPKIEDDQQNDQQATSKRPHTINRVSKDTLYPPNSDSYLLAEHLYETIKARLPKFGKKDLQKWAKHVDLMIRIDGREVDHIGKVIDWCQADTFWKKNILSTEKLRKKFDDLYAKMDSGK